MTTEAEITIKFNPHGLRGYTDEFLATLWHLAQANPAPFGDKDACALVEKIGREIIRRWLGGVEPELWHHQGNHQANALLSEVAHFDGDSMQWVLGPAGDVQADGAPEAER